jgi:signal peptidase
MDGHAIVVGRLPGVPRPSTQPGLAPAERTADSAVRRLARRVGRLALNCAFVAMIASVLIMLVPALLGFQRYVILTGSMTGTYDRGSIVFDRPIPTADLKVGDPITYAPPPGFTSQTRVTHRIWWIGRGANGERVYRTKGDANKHPDVWKFTLNHSTQDVVVFHIPDVGYVFTLLSLRDFRIALLGLPAIVIALMTLRALWIEGGKEARRQKLAELGWQAITDTGIETILPPLDVPDTNPRPVWLGLRLTAVHAGAPRFASTNRPPGSPRATLHVGRLVSAHTMANS